VEAIAAHGTAAQRDLYLPKLVSGEWTGTMNLTEPQAGSDVGALRTRAVPEGDQYRITGQKIFITYGEHDFAENIVHLVLARTPDAPEGTKGISLFIVPKFIPRSDGTLGDRNDLRCLSLEHKLGIHASPTCVMSYGEASGAIGYRVGEERRGMEYMFTMMNNARLAVGVQGLAIGERALQQARNYAHARIQGRDAASRDAAPVPIIRHPDVRRMLLTMRATVEAMRALIYFTAAAIDRARRTTDPQTRQREQALAELLTPVAKAWCTDRGAEVASVGVQVHGGVGFIESTGAAQLYRDARIAPIYEGTNGIQAADLVGRKLLRDGGEAMRALIERIAATSTALPVASDAAFRTIAPALRAATSDLDRTTNAMLATAATDLPAVLAGATPFLNLTGTVISGWLLALQAEAAVAAIAAGRGDPAFLKGKLAIARYFADNLLPQTAAFAHAATDGAKAVTAIHADQV
jgi:alkylation response protein AidB-like acyl-CoA dehydrogenase